MMNGLNQGRRVRLRESLGKQLLDLSVRLALGRSQKILGRLRRQVTHQQPHGTERQATVGDGKEDPRKLPGLSCRSGALVGDVLGHPQLADAVQVHRRVALVSVEATAFELRDLNQHAGGRRTVLSDDRVQIATEHRVVSLRCDTEV